MAQDDHRVFETVARAGRDAIRRVWNQRSTKDALDPAARRLLGILEMHEEFHPFWAGAEPNDQENPFIHVMYHDLLEVQIETGDPPEARAAMDRLVSRGLDRHAALHQVLRVLVVEMFRMTQNQGHLDRDAYRTALETLGRPDPAEPEDRSDDNDRS